MSTHAERLSKVERDQGFPNSRPKDASSIILLDRKGKDRKSVV